MQTLKICILPGIATTALSLYPIVFYAAMLTPLGSALVLVSALARPRAMISSVVVPLALVGFLKGFTSTNDSFIHMRSSVLFAANRFPLTPTSTENLQ